MHGFRKPNQPNGFDRAIETHRQALSRAIDQGQSPSFESDVWKAYKGALSAAQHRKCGFCETLVTVGSYGDVEHYRPKGAVWSIRNPGRGVRNLANVEGRTPQLLSARGYWWLAYDWHNWLLACQICNQGWKRSFFPIREHPNNLPPREGFRETPLLLNPFGRKRPGKHLKFGRLGEVEPRRNSRFGRATIEVCGLNRPSLREARLEKAERIYRLIDGLRAAAEPRVDEIMADIHRLGHEFTAHCGMVRAVFEEDTGITWRQLQQHVATA